ncbi:MAG: glycerol-3-phosphate dehydrogenase, partial [Pseudomonas sp.]|nr:glycerol-3-phosphate dehydrogenase [Pseudomonas sp.]
SAKRAGGIWHVELQREDGSRFSLKAKALVNAAGPWVAQFIGENLQQRSPYGIRLIQGSHIIVPKLYDGEQAYIMQNEDRRIVFAIPYLDRYTMIGTTDREYRGDPAKVSISEEEIAYVLGVANTHFRKQLEPRDIVHTFAGVRPLCDDESDNPSAVTRDYTLSLAAEEKQAPLLSVFGGKLTTYRKLAESAMVQLKPFFPAMGESWTAQAALPGGEGMSTADALAEELVAKVQGLKLPLAKRWATLYGNRVWRMLGEARSLDALGEDIGQQLYAQEVDYLRREEWATHVDDILWRRTKLGLAFSEPEMACLQRYLTERPVSENTRSSDAA